MAVPALVSLTILGYYVEADVAGAIATVVIAVAGSNAMQKVGEKKYTNEDK